MIIAAGMHEGSLVLSARRAVRFFDRDPGTCGRIFNTCHVSLLASKFTKQGVYKSKGTSGPTILQSQVISDSSPLLPVYEKPLIYKHFSLELVCRPRYQKPKHSKQDMRLGELRY